MTEPICRLLVFVRSDYQLLNALAAIKKRDSEYKEVFLFYSGYWGTSSFLKSCLINKGWISFDKKNDMLSYVRGCRVDVISSGFEFSVKFLNNVDNYICVDDGIGSYASFFHLYKAAIREKSSFKIKLLYPIYYSFLKVCFYFGLYQKESAFSKGRVNADYKNALLEVLSEIEQCNDQPLLNEGQRNRPVFCSQPYLELGIFTDFEYRSFLKKVEKHLGRKLIIVRHPGDKAFNYKEFEVIDCVMFELFLFKNKEFLTEVVSVNSTCLLTASSIFELKALSFNNKLTKPLGNNFSEDLNRLWHNYIDGVYF